MSKSWEKDLLTLAGSDERKKDIVKHVLPAYDQHLSIIHGYLYLLYESCLLSTDGAKEQQSNTSGLTRQCYDLVQRHYDKSWQTLYQTFYPGLSVSDAKSIPHLVQMQNDFRQWLQTNAMTFRDQYGTRPIESENKAQKESKQDFFLPLDHWIQQIQAQYAFPDNGRLESALLL